MRAGTIPASAQVRDCWEIQLTNTRLAIALFSSGFSCRGSTNWWEPAQTACVPPMLGTGAAPHWSFLMAFSGVVFHGPLIMKAALSLVNETKLPSSAAFLGL